MKTKKERLIGPGLLAALLLPVALVGLFYLVIQNRAWINGWVFGVMAPLEQALGRFWSRLPFWGGWVLTALFLAGSVVWIIWTAVDGIRRRSGRRTLRRVLAFASAWLWLWCGLCWLWNGAYYADTFAQRAGLETAALFGGRAGFRHGLFCQAGGRPV